MREVYAKNSKGEEREGLSSLNRTSIEGKVGGFDENPHCGKQSDTGRERRSGGKKRSTQGLEIAVSAQRRRKK